MRIKPIEYMYQSDIQIRQAFAKFADYVKAAEDNGWVYEINPNDPSKEWKKILDDERYEDNYW